MTGRNELAAPLESIRNVVVIDDDPAALESFGALLESGGYETTLYRSCEEFLAQPATSEPACLVLDAKFQHMSGLGLLEMLRGQGRALPTVFIMGRFDQTTRARALRFPAVVDVLDKPVEAPTLFKAIKTALCRQSAAVGVAP